MLASQFSVEILPFFFYQKESYFDYQKQILLGVCDANRHFGVRRQCFSTRERRCCQLSTEVVFLELCCLPACVKVYGLKHFAPLEATFRFYCKSRFAKMQVTIEANHLQPPQFDDSPDTAEVMQDESVAPQQKQRRDFNNRSLVCGTLGQSA